MKYVYSSHSEVSHVFAQKSQDGGKAGNVFFDNHPTSKIHHGNKSEYGQCLYSYGHHYLLAQWLDNDIVYINDSGYSSSTGKHISIANGALSHVDAVWHSQIDLADIVEQMEANLKKLTRARKPHIYIGKIKDIYRGHLRAKETLKRHKVKPVKGSGLHALLCIGNRKLKNKAKRIFESVDTPEYREALEKKEAKAEAVKKRKEAHELKLFFQGKLNYLNSHKLTYLRVNGDFIESSKGMKADIKDVQLLYKALTWDQDIVGKSIRNFRIERADGKFVRIGCHLIARTHLNSVMKGIK